jgi:PKD repeat protein
MCRIDKIFKKFICIIIFALPLSSLAQTDTEFWFVVPEITINHGVPGGRPAYLRFASTGLAATITISQPATPTFTPIVINLAANASYSQDMSAFIALNVAGTWTDQNLLENKPLNATGINNFGLYIKSTTPITVYYEINNSWNGEIWALKGRNALGTNFYTPFQQLTANGNYPGPPDATAQPYSAIDIVATEDGTTVTVTPTKNAGYGNGGLFIAANTPRTFTLNKGQTLSIFPQNKSQATANRLSGTHVTSDKPIAISLKDDSISHTNGGCKDALGDQLIPVNVAGVDYICNRTFLTTEDNVIVVATQNLTDIYVNDVKLNGAIPLNAGQQFRISLNPVTYPLNYIKISSRPNSASTIYRPIIVYHIGGFGCEVGAAVIPPIDVCTGSSKVSFSRSNATPFYLTMMVRDGAQGKFLVDGVVRNDIIDSTAFVLVPGTQWRVARFGRPPAPAPAPYGVPIALLPVGQHTVSNTRDIFHLGIFNGDASTTCWFGYFSDFNKFDPQSFVVETGGPGNLLCYGDSAQLYASGGTKYNWVPSDFLDDPFKDTPTARNVTKSVKYEVTVSGVCGLSATKEVNLIVAPYMNPKFTTDVFAGCAPLTVNITNSSTGVGLNFWDLNSDGDLTDPYEGLNNAATFPVVFDNTTNDTIRYYITLLATDASMICWKEVTKSVLVYPRISASLTTTIPDVNHCHPLNVTFNNTSTANGSTYSWNFGDGGSSYDKNPVHIYNNFNIGPTTFVGSLLVTDKYNYCKVSAPLSVLVQPYIKASFVIDKVESCSPFNLTVLNDSKGGVNNYYWDRDGDLATGPSGFEYSVPTATGWSLPYFNTTSTNTPRTVTIRLKVTNAAGCSDIASRTITIDPPVSASFITNNNGNPLGCSPLTLNFTGTTTNAEFYQWLEGSNEFSKNITAVDTLKNFGATPVTKTITFIASNHYGCSTTQISNVIVQPWINASVAIDNELGCSPLVVNFTNTSSIGSTAFQWDFGNDGSIDFSTKNIPAQTFNYPIAQNNTFVPYTIPIKLTASNASGCASSTIKNITVNPQSTVNFTYTDNSNPNHCSPLNAGFTSTVTNTETYQWEFGTFGASIVANPNFTFTNDDVSDITAPVSLQTDNRFGCSAIITQNVLVRHGVKALFSLDKTKGCPPFDANVSATTSTGITNYTWDFNGTPYTGPVQIFPNPTNVTGVDVNKKVLLTVSSGFCSDTTSKSIVVYPQVEALYTALPLLTGCSPLTVNFVNQSALYGTSAPINSIVWDFNDSSSSNATSIGHTFVNSDNTLPKTFNVTLTATTDKGCTDTKTIPVTTNPNVTAAFNAQIVQPCTPMQIRVVNASFGGPTITTPTWNFNGGVPLGVVDDDFIVEYTNADPENAINRDISLDLLNTFGCSSSTSQTFTIDPKVVAGINIVSPLTGGGVPIDRLCAPAIFTFGNQSTGGNISFVWDFDDGEIQNISNRNNNQHQFENRSAITKTFNVELIASNVKGCSDTTVQTVQAYPEVDSKFSMVRDSACTPFYIRLADGSLNGTQWSWDFGHTIAGVPQLKTSLVSGEVFTKLIDNETVTDQTKNYKINLRVDDLVTGCWDTISQMLEVFPKVVTTMVPDKPIGCSEHKVIFDNQSTGGVLNFFWSFGDGQSANSLNRDDVTHTFINRGVVDSIRSVLVTSTNINGCFNSKRYNITTHPQVESDFRFTMDSVCTPFMVRFENNGLNGNEFKWDFGHMGLTSTKFNKNVFTQVFDNSQLDATESYTIKLVSIDNLTGCKDSLTRPIEVYPRVVTNMVPDNPVGCSEHKVIFDNQSTGGVLNFAWLFDDGQSANSINRDDVTHTFMNRGVVDSIRSVLVTSTNINGCFNSQRYPITTHPKVEAAFTFTNQSLCTPFYLDLANSGLNGNKFFWDFGYSGLTAIKKDKSTFSQLFDNPTANTVLSYTIRLISRDSITGCADTTSRPITVFPKVISQFDVDRIIGCNPLPVDFTNLSSGLASYLWDFGDGTISVADSPSKNYSHPNKNSFVDYTVSLTSTNVNGCKSIKDTVIRVNPLVAAMFQVNQINGCTPLNINLSNSSVSPLYNYSWDFGDTRTSALEQPLTIQYTNSTQTPPVIQNRTIELITSYVGDATCADTFDIPIQVYPHIYPDFNIVNNEACHPLTTDIINNTVSFNTSNNYLWDLGNGTFSSLKDLTSLDYKNSSFTKDTVYNIKLTATSVHQCVDSVKKSLTVHPRPVAAYLMNNESLGCSPFPISLSNQSTGTGLSYTFDLGDGTIINTIDRNQVITHTYHNLTSNVEPYVISLNATTGFGCQNSTSQTIYAYPEVTAGFDFDPGNSSCSPFNVKLLNTSTNEYFYQWNFKDGTNSSLKDPTHRFVNVTEKDTTFKIFLRSISEYDCEDTITRPLTVYATPVADYSIDPPLKIFPDATFNFFNQTRPAADSWTYSWTFGDGYTSSSKQPGNHTYTTWGPKSNGFIYKTTLRVENAHCWDTTSSILRLLPAEPRPFFTSDIYESCSPLEAHLINASQYGSNYLWDFGDGTTSTIDEPIHTFTIPGYKTFRVFQNPIADFAVYPNRVMLPDATVHIYNLTKYGDRYEWDLGDGTLLTDKDPVHTYTKLGEFRVSLRAYAADSLGACQDYTSKFPAVWVEGIGEIKFPNAFMPSKNGPNGGVYDDIDYK